MWISQFQILHYRFHEWLSHFQDSLPLICKMLLYWFHHPPESMSLSWPINISLVVMNCLVSDVMSTMWIIPLIKLPMGQLLLITAFQVLCFSFYSNSHVFYSFESIQLLKFVFILKERIDPQLRTIQVDVAVPIWIHFLVSTFRLLSTRSITFLVIYKKIKISFFKETRTSHKRFVSTLKWQFRCNFLFSGSQVNGVWSLYFKDDCALQLSSLQGFTFTFYCKFNTT